MESIASSASSESSSSAELVSEPYETFGTDHPLELVRALIAALVASINTHCHSTGAGNASLATTEFENQAEGILSDEEIAHAKSILDHVQHAPAPINAFPDAPVPEEVSSSSSEVDPQTQPYPIQTFNGLPPYEESSSSESSSTPA